MHFTYYTDTENYWLSTMSPYLPELHLIPISTWCPVCFGDVLPAYIMVICHLYGRCSPNVVRIFRLTAALSCTVHIRKYIRVNKQISNYLFVWTVHANKKTLTAALNCAMHIYVIQAINPNFIQTYIHSIFHPGM